MERFQLVLGLVPRKDLDVANDKLSQLEQQNFALRLQVANLTYRLERQDVELCTANEGIKPLRARCAVLSAGGREQLDA